MRTHSLPRNPVNPSFIPSMRRLSLWNSRWAFEAAGYFQQFLLMPSAPVSTSCSYADLFGRENSPNDSALLRGHWTISEEEAVSFQFQEVSLELFVHHLISLAEKATFGHSQLILIMRVTQFEAHTVADSAGFTRLKDDPLPMGDDLGFVPPHLL